MPKHRTMKIKGSVILQKKNVLDFNDYVASMIDNMTEFLGKVVSLQLVSAVNGDPAMEMKGKVGAPAYLEEWITTPDTIVVGESIFTAYFDWDEGFGIPGAFIIRNQHHSQFYLKTLTLDDVPGNGRVHFVCNSWVYPTKYYNYDRVFFANKSYLPIDTPEPLRKYREEELVHLRGTGIGELREWDRVYDYAFYNDLGRPDESKELARPVLGGSEMYPYPRRVRTGRAPTKTDPQTESRLPMIILDNYVPRDERLGHLKISDFLAYALKSAVQFIVPELKALFNKTPNEFDTFQETLDLYEGGIKLPELPEIDKLKDLIPLEIIKQLVITSNGERLLKFPMPQVIQVDKSAWRTDEEFAREMLAGMNPLIIRRLIEFPPTSKLDPEIYGNQHSSITKEHIVKNLDGLTVDEALMYNKLFILDYHDYLMPYINEINSTKTKTYASRTILFLKEDGTLRPLAIELSLPNPEGKKKGAISRVFTPADHGVECSIWHLAKGYVLVNDTGVHQLISHWLNTHCVMEPIVIASNRQMSILHPIHKLLSPHFRDTMHMNALARQILISGGGIIESVVFSSKFSMEMSSMIYKNWMLVDQGLPADLLKRGMAVPDPNQPFKLRLLIEDYPYAVDGLDIWSAIETWVAEYCSIYYPNDYAIQTDTELQAWWKEIREVGHGDKRDEPWWPTMQTVPELTDTLTTIIWICSAVHAAVNFGQYAYSGYVMNQPTITRRFMPEPGSQEFAELEKNPDSVFLKTINSQFQTLLTMTIIEILSMHSTDEVYLGQAVMPEWTCDSPALDAFRRFGEKLVEIEKKIVERNNDERLKNRVGLVHVPYTLLYPNTSDVSRVGGMSGKGIPNSVSI